jgi:hypothetical protein
MPTPEAIEVLKTYVVTDAFERLVCAYECAGGRFFVESVKYAHNATFRGLREITLVEFNDVISTGKSDL